MSRARTIRRYAVRVVAGLFVVVAVLVAWQAVQLYLAWRKFDHVEFDPAASRDALPTQPSTTTQPPDEVLAAPLPDFLSDPDAVDVFLLLGSDEDKPNTDALRADAVLLFVWPQEGSVPALLSFPRDLYVTNPCTGQEARLNAMLDGCGGAINGPELLALTLEDYTGLSVDHFAVISFTGFQAIIEELGGVEVCVPRALRLGRLVLQEGCTVLDGREALFWLRERAPFELIDGEWVAAPAGDLARVERQQVLMVELLRRLRRFRSPLELSDVVSGLSDAFVLDESLNLPRAVSMAWDLRRVSPTAVHRATLPVEDHVTGDGEFVRLPVGTFEDVLRSIYAPETATATG